MATNKFKTGDYIIDFANIYKILKIGSGEEALVHYKQVTGNNKDYTATIPLKNLEKSGLRRLLTAEEAKKVVDSLKAPVAEYPYKSQEIKEEIYRNSPSTIVTPLKMLWKIAATIPKGDMELREEMIEHIVTEVAFVTKEAPKTVRDRVEKNLNR